MSGRERRMADQTPVAVEHRDFDLYRLAGNDLCRRCSRGARDRIAERDAVFLRVAECFGRSVGGEDALGEGFGTAGALGELGEDCEIDLRHAANGDRAILARASSSCLRHRRW